MTNAELNATFTGPEPCAPPREFSTDQYRRVGRAVCENRKPRFPHGYVMAEMGAIGETLMQMLGEERTLRVHAEDARESIQRTATKALRRHDEDYARLQDKHVEDMIALDAARKMYVYDTDAQGKIIHARDKTIRELQERVKEPSNA